MAGISSDSASASALMHDHFKDMVVQTFGEIEELKTFEVYKAGADKLPAEKRKYKIRLSEGSKSVGARSVAARVMPYGQEVRYTEGEYQVKRYDTTLEFGTETLHALDRAAASGELTSGAFQSANEHVNDIMKAKANVLAHLKLIDCYGDGTGVIGEVGVVTGADSTTGYVTLTLKSGYAARGSITFMRLGIDLLAAAPAGTLRTFSTAGAAVLAVDSMTVESIDVANNKIVVALRNAAGTLLTGNATTTLVADDYLYMGCVADATAGEEIIPDLSGAIADYDSISAHILGLRGLVRADGVTVQGLVRSGMHASQVITKSDETLDPKFLTALLIQLKRRMSGSMGSFTWRNFIMSEEALDFLIVSNMSYRSLNVAHGEAARGVPAAYGATKFNYTESVSGRNEAWEFTGSCFCPLFEIFAMPTPGKNDRGSPLAFAYTEMQDPFADWSAGNDGFLPKIDSSGRYNLAKISHKRMWSCMYTEVPASLGKLQGFKLS